MTIMTLNKQFSTGTASGVVVRVSQRGEIVVTNGGMSGVARPASGIPAMIPADELYFWTARWQAQEAEFEHDKTAETLLRFETMGDAISHLMRVEDDEDE